MIMAVIAPKPPGSYTLSWLIPNEIVFIVFRFSILDITLGDYQHSGDVSGSLKGIFLKLRQRAVFSSIRGLILIG